MADPFPDFSAAPEAAPAFAAPPSDFDFDLSSAGEEARVARRFARGAHNSGMHICDRLQFSPFRLGTTAVVAAAAVASSMHRTASRPLSVHDSAGGQAAAPAQPPPHGSENGFFSDGASAVGGNFSVSHTPVEPARSSAAPSPPVSPSNPLPVASSPFDDDDMFSAETAATAPGPAPVGVAPSHTQGAAPTSVPSATSPPSVLPPAAVEADLFTSSPSAPAATLVTAAVTQPAPPSSQPAFVAEPSASSLLAAWAAKNAADLAARREHEANEKRNVVEEAAAERALFHNQRAKKIEAAMASHRVGGPPKPPGAEPGTVWEKVASLIESDSGAKPKGDLTKFKALLLTLKREGKKGDK